MSSVDVAYLSGRPPSSAGPNALGVIYAAEYRKSIPAECGFDGEAGVQSVIAVKGNDGAGSHGLVYACETGGQVTYQPIDAGPFDDSFTVASSSVPVAGLALDPASSPSAFFVVTAGGVLNRVTFTSPSPGKLTPFGPSFAGKGDVVGLAVPFSV